MYLFEYHKNPRLFWATMAGLLVVVVMLWPSNPKCSDLNGQTWDYSTNTPINCTK
jgi:hypothetical protein